jgi:anti-sigma regulatory factor (Ser/Thr protein kinase)
MTVITLVADQSQVAEARRLATRMAAESSLNEDATGRAAIVATELATNLLKHAGEGSIIARPFSDGEGEGIELLGLDRGPGMADVAQCLADGFTTVGSRGNGLGAIRRLSQGFAVFSRPGMGTAIMARLTDGTARPRRPTDGVLGAVEAICPGETVSGDSWRVRFRPGGARLIVADGSGHGEMAALAARRAAEVFEAEGDRPLEVLADWIHRALAATRGGAVGLADIDHAGATVRFVGIGNIAGSLYDAGGMKKLVSMNGIAGHLTPRIREFAYPFRGTPTLILHSDGIDTRWDLTAYPGLLAAHPSLAAGILYRDHRRARDDATAVVVRVGQA